MRVLITEELTEKIMDYGWTFYENSQPLSQMEIYHRRVSALIIPCFLLPLVLGYQNEYWASTVNLAMMGIVLFELVVLAVAFWVEQAYRSNLGNPKVHQQIAELFFSKRGYLAKVMNIPTWMVLVWSFQMFELWALEYSGYFWLFATIFLAKVALEYLIVDLCDKVLQWVDPTWTGRIKIFWS